MGVVFRAVRDDEHFSKEVAIKLIEPGMRSEGILKRFRAERQILAMLDHPHIARLIDGGSAPDGSPYLVMEYVAGKPLLRYCDEQKLGIDERLALFLEVCDAVQFAHQQPRRSPRSEVRQRPRRRGRFAAAPRLRDRQTDLLGGGSSPLTLTAPMNRMLTPDYASPEQVRGEPVTVAGDVYSLGVILYELLTGTRPLPLRNADARGDRPGRHAGGAGRFRARPSRARVRRRRQLLRAIDHRSLRRRALRGPRLHHAEGAGEGTRPALRNGGPVRARHPPLLGSAAGPRPRAGPPRTFSRA